MMSTISVSMIVRDEEEMLERALFSVIGADEIVILDTGSTDRTPQIAKKYTDKYIFGEYKWNDNYAEARNESLKRCTGDWILIIDADEQLETGGIQKIRALIENLPPETRAIGFKTMSESRRLMHRSVRLFRNNIGIVWHGWAHNYLSERAQLQADIVLRYGYSPAHVKDPDRTFRILSKYIAENPGAGRERFYLAREYWYKKEYKEALRHYKLYLEKATWLPEIAEAWMQAARCYYFLNELFPARLACLRALEVNADFKDALTLMSQLSSEPNTSKWKEYSMLAKNTNTLFATPVE